MDGRAGLLSYPILQQSKGGAEGILVQGRTPPPGAGLGLFSSQLDPQQTKPDDSPATRRGRTYHSGADREWDRRQEGQAYLLPPLTHAEQIFRHGGWARDRERVRRAIHAAGAPATRLERFDNCGCDCVIEVRSDGQAHRVRASYCGDRFCVPCAKARSIKITANLVEWVAGQRAKFLTLTLLSSDRPLSETMDHLIRSFARLRAQKLWSENVSAGAYVVELTRGKSGTHWHVHLHALLIASYIDVRLLSQAWYQATGDSFIVNLQEVKDRERAVGYVAKYASKGWGADVLQDHDAAVECVCALRGRRLLGTFGAWRGRKLEVRRDDQHEWRSVGRFDHVHAAALRGEEWARGVFKSLGVACGVFSDRPIFVGPEDDSG